MQPWLWVLPTGCGVGTFIPAITLLFCACAVGILPHNRATKTKPDQMFNINRSFWQLNVFVILWIYKKKAIKETQQSFRSYSLFPPLTIIGAYVESVDSECWKSWLDETNWSPRVGPWFRLFFPYGALSCQHLHRSSKIFIFLRNSSSIQGLSERMAKVKRFLWALNFTKSWFSQLSLVEN